MIPTPRGPGDVLPSPEEPRPIARGEGPASLVFQAMEEIEALKNRLGEALKRVEALEGRVSALEGKTA